MKKFLLKAGKKTLSVFLACLMLMTCWVFVAPEHNHAEAVEYNNVEAYNTSLLDGISFNTNVTTIWDLTWEYNGDYQGTYEQEAYKNVLYSSTCSDKTATTGSVSLKDSGAATLSWYHGTTTFLYDGSTTPRTGVMLNVQVKNTSTNVRTYSCYVTGTGLSMGNTYWYGYDSRANFMYVIQGPNSKNCATIDGTRGDNAWTVSSSTYFANYISFTGSMSSTEFYRDITPTWTWVGNQKSQGTGTYYTKTATSGNHIYVINWVPLKAAYTTAANLVATVKANPGKYSTRSVADLATICKNLMAAHPNNYVNSTTNNPSGYATAASAAVSALNNFSLEERKYDIQAENLFSFADWYYSKSNTQPGSAYSYSANVDAGTLYIASYASTAEVTTPHSSKSTRNQNMYAIPVEGGEDYTIEWTTSCGSTGDIPSAQSSEIFLFFYDENNEPFDSWANYSPDGKSSGVNSGTVTAPVGAKYMELRFDFNNNSYAGNITFSNIKVYKSERATEISRSDWLSGLDIRQVYSYNGTVGTLAEPTRKGYRFDGWQVDIDGDGVGDYDVSSSDPVQRSWPLYSKWTKKTLDIGYDNLFSFSDWYYSKSNAVNDSSRGTMTADVENGTMTFVATVNDFFSPNNGASGYYTVDVEPSTTYILDYDLALTSGGMQIGAWYYTDSLSASTVDAYDISYAHAGGEYEFTTPSDCTKVAFRFGVTGAKGNGTFSNITLVKKADYDAYVSGYAKVREPFKYGDTNNLMTPSRDGYIFDGWFTADGTKITSVAGLYESDTVYAHWTKTHTVTFLNGNGNTMHTATVITGNALTSDQYPAANPTKASDASNSYTFTGWDYVDGTAITSDITVKPIFTSRAHSNFKYTLVTEATCEKNAVVKKVCGNCNYSFGNVVYDGSATDHPEFIAKGHDYDGQPAVVGSATLVDGVSKHQVLCSRYYTENCGGYTYVDHEWSFVKTTGATCTINGTNHYQCACQATKTEEGLIAPTVHLNTTIINVKQENCTENGYTGDTQCSDCKEIIVYGETIPALGHTWKNTKTYPTEIVADCTTDAVYWQECETCGISAKDDTTDTGSTWTDTGSATGHKWLDEGTELYSPADCETDEVYYQTCDYCGISAKDDTTGTGSTWTKADTKWNHNFAGDYVTNNDGTHGRKCSNAGCSEIGDRTDCTYGAWDTNNADTHTKICTACSYKYTEKHSWSAWTSTDPSKTEDGQMTRSCEICGRTEKTDCQYDVTADVKETCETDAYKTYTCADCGHGYTVIDKDSATGHNFDGEYRFNANTDFHNRKCTNDGCSKYGIGIKVDASGVNKWEACSWTYAKKEDGIHTATCVCDNSQDEECSGGEATCTTPATCDKCEEKYGETAPHNYSGTVVVLRDDNEDSHAYRCKFCDDQDLYGVGEEEGATEKCNGGDATCSEKATCDVCGDEYGEVDSEDHILSSWSDNENGTHTRTCTREGCAHGENGDAYSETENCVAGSQKEVVADCVSEGYMINVCAECGYEWDSDDVAPAGHKFGAWISDGEGSHTRTCIRPGCKYNETSDGPATETNQCTKDNATEVVTAPTCTEKGYTTYTCKDCGYSWVDEDSYTDPTGHTYEDKRKAVSATYLRTEQSCTEDLTYWYRCDNCNESAKTGATYTEETVENFYWVSKEASSHSFTKKTVTDDYRKSVATCTARAVYYYSCSACDISSEGTDGEKTFLYGSVLGHDWIETESADYLASPADCVNDATYYKHCSRCTDVSSKTWTKEESKTGHDFDHDDDEEVGDEGDAGYTAAVEATCTQAGVVAHYTCQVCGKYYEDADATTELTKITVKANGHVWQSVGYKEATCEEAGHTSHKECTVCEEKDSKFAEYEATGHNFTGDYVYHDNGYHSKLCVNDGCEASGLEKVKYSETTDEATDETVIAGAEKCEITGDYTHVAEDDKHYHSQSCVCGNTKKTECTEENDPVVTAPTCTEDGYTTHECSVCEEKWITDIVDALEHDLTDTATSNNDGATHSVKCKREGCDYKADAENCYGGTATCKEQATCEVCAQKYGTTGDHTLTEDGWESNGDATCTVNGTESQNCSVCEETIKRTEEDSALDHNMTGYGYDVSTWTYGSDEVKATVKAPTCAAEGKAISYCTRCDHYVTKTVAKLKDAHVWAADATTGEETWEYVSGDCSTYITYKCVCTQCGTVKTKTEQVEHDWTTVVTKVEATCKKEGYRTLKCGNCGAQKTEILQSAEHKWGDWSTYTEATCCEAEVEIRTCSACKTTEKRTGDVSATGIHNASNLVKWQAEPATCEADGFIEHYRSSCGKYFVSSDKGKTFTQVEWSQIKRGGTGHTDSNSDGKCDSCNTVLNSGTTTSDSCICHKTNWFMKTIYSVLKFFWKIFGINKTCDCGVTHY